MWHSSLTQPDLNKERKDIQMCMMTRQKDDSDVTEWLLCFVFLPMVMFSHHVSSFISLSPVMKVCLGKLQKNKRKYNPNVNVLLTSFCDS